MKYSQLTGIIASLLIIIICLFPWCTVDSLHITISGTQGFVNENLNFGRQIIPHTFFALLLILFFSVNKVWAKRTNIFVAFLQLGWAFKNYILFTLCRTGICPEIQPALYCLPVLSILIQIMTLVPKMKVEA